MHQLCSGLQQFESGELAQKLGEISEANLPMVERLVIHLCEMRPDLSLRNADTRYSHIRRRS